MLPSPDLLSRLAPLRPVEGARGVLAHQSADVVALWLAWEEECGREQTPPFWATTWPAAVVLARCVLDGAIAVAGRSVLDLGCGGAVAGIAAALGGAREVEANDVDPVALHVAERNARANGVSLRTTSVDYAAVPLPAADVVLVADLFYERAPSLGLLARLRAAAGARTPVYVADAGRPFAPRGEGWPVHEETRAVDADLEGAPSRTVRVFRLT